jgi:hypothetical protein
VALEDIEDEDLRALFKEVQEVGSEGGDGVCVCLC